MPPRHDRGWRGRSSDELFLLVALAVGLGTAALTQAAGLSLGARGLPGRPAHQRVRLRARDAARASCPCATPSSALFFVTIGALIDPALIMANLPLLGTMIALVVVGKLVLRTLVVWLFGQPSCRPRCWSASG